MTGLGFICIRFQKFLNITNKFVCFYILVNAEWITQSRYDLNNLASTFTALIPNTYRTHKNDAFWRILNLKKDSIPARTIPSAELCWNLLKNCAVQIRRKWVNQTFNLKSHSQRSLWNLQLHLEAKNAKF